MRAIIQSSTKMVLSAKAVNFMRPAAVNFSKLAKKGQEKSLNLAELIPQEIAVEAAEQEIDQDYLDVKKVVLANFALSDKTGNGAVQLTRQHGNESITIRFDVQDEHEEDGIGSEDGDEMDNDEEDENEETDATYGIRFEVESKKGDSTLLFDCFAGEKVTIKNVMHLPDGKTLEKNSELYGGPRFEDLEPAVQDGFYHYLSERKIDEDIAFFVLSHSREKEQSEYVNWLHSVLGHVTK